MKKIKGKYNIIAGYLFIFLAIFNLAIAIINCMPHYPNIAISFYFSIVWFDAYVCHDYIDIIDPAVYAVCYAITAYALFAKKHKLCVFGFLFLAVYNICVIIFLDIYGYIVSPPVRIYTDETIGIPAYIGNRVFDLFTLDTLFYLSTLCMTVFLILSEKGKLKAKKFIWAVPSGLLLISYLPLLIYVTTDNIMLLMYSVIHIFAFIFTSAYMKNKNTETTERPDSAALSGMPAAAFFFYLCAIHLHHLTYPPK